MNKDICPICNKEINLALPHAVDRKTRRFIHRECKPDQKEDNVKIQEIADMICHTCIRSTCKDCPHTDEKNAKVSKSAAMLGCVAWFKAEERMPEYYEDVWASDGVAVVFSRLVGRSYTPNRQIWRNLERGGCAELCGIKFWMPVIKPTAP